MNDLSITIRAATIGDADALSRLAALDSGRPLRGEALAADRDRVMIAAVALSNGSVVADPFQGTADAVGLLRQRRYRVLRQGGDVGRVRSQLRRLAPAVQG